MDRLEPRAEPKVTDAALTRARRAQPGMAAGSPDLTRFRHDLQRMRSELDRVLQDAPNPADLTELGSALERLERATHSMGARRRGATRPSTEEGLDTAPAANYFLRSMQSAYGLSKAESAKYFDVMAREFGKGVRAGKIPALVTLRSGADFDVDIYPLTERRIGKSKP